MDGTVELLLRISILVEEEGIRVYPPLLMRAISARPSQQLRLRSSQRRRSRRAVVFPNKSRRSMPLLRRFVPTLTTGRLFGQHSKKMDGGWSKLESTTGYMIGTMYAQIVIRETAAANFILIISSLKKRFVGLLDKSTTSTTDTKNLNPRTKNMLNHHKPIRPSHLQSVSSLHQGIQVLLKGARRNHRIPPSLYFRLLNPAPLSLHRQVTTTTIGTTFGPYFKQVDGEL
mmetsp:Transcript_23213/g.29815  ORF Transcript_23213/g.29815 Transcript_23213/m.29815 type:complete len:229 (+) Transcript_23213:130-816(+)